MVLTKIQVPSVSHGSRVRVWIDLSTFTLDNKVSVLPMFITNVCVEQKFSLFSSNKKERVSFVGVFLEIVKV